MAMAQASQLLRIGPRGSRLARAQARAVARLLASKFSPDRITLQVIRTTGDMIRDRPLAEAGGQGLLTKATDEALLGGSIDLAVHWAKDMPPLLPQACISRPCCRAK